MFNIFDMFTEWHEVLIQNNNRFSEVHDWCEKEFGKSSTKSLFGVWYSSLPDINGTRFHFKIKDDAMQFKLTWG